MGPAPLFRPPGGPPDGNADKKEIRFFFPPLGDILTRSEVEAAAS